MENDTEFFPCDNRSSITNINPNDKTIRPLKRALKGRHIQMIALGGAIGSGLFVGTGAALQVGGPGSLIVSYMIVAGMLLLTMQALGELAVQYPVNGAFFDYCCRFIDPAWGFAVGWDYTISLLWVLPLEITSGSLMIIRYWNTDYHVSIWLAIFVVLLAAVQVFGVRGYGEVEFILGTIKVTSLVGFIILGLVIDFAGAPPGGGYLGAQYWHNPGAFIDFPGFCAVFVTAGFAFGGTELTGLAAAEAANPAKSVSQACRQVFWRISILYILVTFVVGLIVPYNAPYLTLSAQGLANASPFVVAIQDARIQVLPTVMNIVIIISLLSGSNAAVYGSSRTLQALALKGMAPKFFTYIDKGGRPLNCIILQFAISFLGFVHEASVVGNTMFTWLIALAGIINFFVWASICLAHIRFRKAWAYNGHCLDELAYTAPFGVTGSWLGLVLNIFCLIVQFYVSVIPKDATVFFQNYLAFPVIVALYIFWKVYSNYRTRNVKMDIQGWRLLRPIEQIDVLTGVRDPALDKNLPPKVICETWRDWPKSILMSILRSVV